MRPQRGEGGRRRALWYVAAIAWAALLFWQSGTSDAGGLLERLPPGSDKVAHAAAFAVLAGLLTMATARPQLAAILATLYGVTDELHQSFVPGRSSDALDLVADAVGSAIGAWVVGYPLGQRRGRG